MSKEESLEIQKKLHQKEFQFFFSSLYYEWITIRGKYTEYTWRPMDRASEIHKTLSPGNPVSGRCHNWGIPISVKKDLII